MLGEVVRFIVRFLDEVVKRGEFGVGGFDVVFAPLHLGQDEGSTRTGRGETLNVYGSSSAP